MLLLIFLFSPIHSLCPKDEYSALNEITVFTVPKLPYQYDSLHPQYWNQLLLFHHDTVHSLHVSSLNSLVSSTPEYQSQTLTSLLETFAASNTSLSRYAGGHYNHCLCWWSLISHKCSESEPSGQLLIDMWDKSAYVDAWWEIIDWGLVEYLYEEYSKELIAIPV